MSTILIWLSTLLLLVNYTFASKGHGFGDDYAWKTMNEGLEVMKNENKMGMLVIHKSWCGACKKLGPQFADDEDLLKLSKDFVMINGHDDDEPKDSQYAPDGGYVPRILFLTPSGKVLTDIINEGGNPEYKYFYFNTEGISKSAKKARGFSKTEL